MDNFHCTDNLRALRDQLKAEFQDEVDAAKKYGAIEFKMFPDAKGLSILVGHMAQDELRHRQILGIIVDYLTERCPEFPTSRQLLPGDEEWYGEYIDLRTGEARPSTHPMFHKAGEGFQSGPGRG